MKTVLLIFTIALGAFFPFTEKYAYMIKYLLMLMLFFSFLSMDVKREHFHISHLKILAVNIITPIVIYYLIIRYNSELAGIAFVTAVAPTAIATPIIIKLLKKEIEYSVISIILTNFSMAIILPVLIPLLIDSKSNLTFSDVMLPVLTVFLIPLLVSEIVRRGFPGTLVGLKKLSRYVFYILIININLGTSKASYYIRQEMGYFDPLIYEVALVSLLLCVFNFYIGNKIAPRKYKIEASQSLGQKNNGFTVWVALTFISPIAVLGPVFYILFQNLYLSWQLHKNEKETQ